MRFQLASLTVLLLASVSATPLGLNGGSDILLPRKAATTASMNMPSVCTSALICKQLSVENVKKRVYLCSYYLQNTYSLCLVPGWATFEKDADANTGTKHLTIRTNDGAVRIPIFILEFLIIPLLFRNPTPRHTTTFPIKR